MDLTRCLRCRRRLFVAGNPNGRTEMVCLTCDDVDPMKTVAMKWAQSGLLHPAPSERES
jgi:hypothetical protein